jgi:adenylate cyclase
MVKETNEKNLMNAVWYWYLTGEEQQSLSKKYQLIEKLQRGLFAILPGAPRCVDCKVPLSGVGSLAVRPLGVRASSFSPRLCNRCEEYVRKHEAGAEVELSLLFADVRGSTELAEKLPPGEFKQLIQRFYKVSTDELIGHNAMINRLMGDQVIGLFAPRFAGHDHAGVAIQAAVEILRATGHQDPGGPWAPVGIGVHTGLAYVGTVGTRGGVNEIAVLGNAANLAARLSSSAAPGEVVVSEAAAAQAVRGASAQAVLAGSENKTLNLKGMSEPISIRVLRVGPE